MSASAPLASVVVPTLNAGPAFEEVLAALRAQRCDGEVELIVLDSESRDGTAERARSAGALVRRIARGTFNHGGTRNLGAALARGRFIAFLTQDAQPANELWLAALVGALERERAVGAYSRVLPRPGCSPLVERSVRADLVYSPQRQVKRASPEEIGRLIAMERRILFHFNNVASCVRREFFARAPFPEIDFGEDLAWGERAVRAGEALVYEPASEVIHSHESALAVDYARHFADARLMRQLLGLRVRTGVRDGWRRWREDVAADVALLRELPLPWREKLASFLYSPFLRAAQVAGQIAGTRAPPAAAPRLPDRLPDAERRAETP